LAGVLFVCATGWNVIDRLSNDALTMGTGLLFGFVAAMPTLLIVAQASRRTDAPKPPSYHYQRDIQPPTPAQITHIHQTHNHVHFHQAQAQPQSVAGATQRKIATHG